MMKRIFIWLLLMGVLTGCVYDRYTPELCSEQGKTYHLAFVLNSAGANLDTKASSGGRDIGLPGEEMLVKKVDLYFYGSDGSLLGKPEVPPFTQQVSSNQTDDIANRVYDFAVELSFRPYLMLVVINSDENLTGSLSDARKRELDGESSWHGDPITINYGGSDVAVRPFRMSSSTYITTGGVERCEVPIPEGYIWETADKAKAHPIPVYIDRLAAKVNVVAPDPVGGKISYPVPVVTQYEGIAAQVELLNWGLNALNKKTYCYKKINTGWTFPTWPINWNESAKFRCHWSEDPNYSTGGTYPKNYGEIQDGTIDLDDCDLQYVSWNNLQGLFTTSSEKNKNPQYCLENTADGGILSTVRSENQLFPRLTHVLVAAQLKFTAGTAFTDDPAGYLDDSASYYRYKGVFYTTNNVIPAIVADLKGQYYRDSGKTSEITASNIGLTHTYGELFYPAFIGAVYDKSGNLVGADALKDKIRVDGFKEGKFYYKIPIEHLTPAPATPGLEYVTAQYGVVRNHNYVIELSDQVAGIGTGVWTLDEPIVPVTEDRDYMVSVSVTVGNWKQFENRFIFVDPSGMLVTNGQVVNRWEDGDNPAGNDWNGNGWYF